MRTVTDAQSYFKSKVRVGKALIGFILLGFGWVGAEAAESRSPRELFDSSSQMIMRFHEAPSAELFRAILEAQPPILDLVKSDGDSAKLAHLERVFRVFVASVWLKQKYPGSPYPEPEMRKTIQEILALKAQSPDDLDLLWAAFFATGEDRYLDRVLKAAKAEDATLASTARWSLAANYRQRKQVKAYFDRRPELKKAIIDPLSK